MIKNLNLDNKQFDAKTYQARISNAKNSLQEPEDIQKTAVSTNDEKFFEDGLFIKKVSYEKIWYQ